VLSARSRASLVEYAARLERHVVGALSQRAPLSGALPGGGGPDDLADLALTLLTARDRFEHRLAVVADSAAALAARLRALVERGAGDGGSTFAGHVRGGAPAPVRAEGAGESVSDWARAWATTNAVTPDEFTRVLHARRVPAPVYPFETTRHWVA